MPCHAVKPGLDMKVGEIPERNQRRSKVIGAGVKKGLEKSNWSDLLITLKNRGIKSWNAPGPMAESLGSLTEVI